MVDEQFGGREVQEAPCVEWQVVNGDGGGGVGSDRRTGAGEQCQGHEFIALGQSVAQRTDGNGDGGDAGGEVNRRGDGGAVGAVGGTARDGETDS